MLVKHSVISLCFTTEFTFWVDMDILHTLCVPQDIVSCSVVKPSTKENSDTFFGGGSVKALLLWDVVRMAGFQTPASPTFENQYLKNELGIINTNTNQLENL